MESQLTRQSGSGGISSKNGSGLELSNLSSKASTLTGACIVALRQSIAGVFTPNDDLANEVLAASEATGEKLWRMPMEESYWESMKSRVVDMVNTSGRPSGAITTALFVKQVEYFVL